ncbi:MAG: hypothetical protein NTV05_11515 [Acidobacteria bacterium]|nr:hypothetical protein [Acidobacteriota bacterium]
MTSALRQKVKVQPGGLIEIRSPELIAGSQADVIVLVDSDRSEGARTGQVAELNAVLRRTQGLPAAREITEQEIAAEIAAYRATRR